MHVHYIGIGGVGMSGLASIDLARGVRVSGSDPQQNASTDRLKAAGANLYSSQLAENILAEKPDLVVFSAAIRNDNPELQAASNANIPVASRAAYLGRLMSEHEGPRIAVTGTHGKTTTTAMIASILVAAGLDPKVLVGAEYGGIGGNVRVGKGQVFLTEACEAYDSFLSLRPDIAVVTNIEADHLDYYGTEERVFESFEKFVRQISATGLVVACGDDRGIKRLVDSLSDSNVRIVKYGLEYRNATIIASAIRQTSGGQQFDVVSNKDGVITPQGTIILPIPGTHSVQNALAAITVGIELGIEFSVISSALSEFCGAERRFEMLAEVDGITVMDDYAHHPTEIRATVAAARSAFPDRRLIVAFQPHLYSRTRDFLIEFAKELSETDIIVVSDIYAAREKPIPGVHATNLVRELARANPGKSVLYAGSVDDVPDKLLWLSRPGDVVFTMGAGDIRSAGEKFTDMIGNRSQQSAGLIGEEAAV